MIYIRKADNIEAWQYKGEPAEMPHWVFVWAHAGNIFRHPSNIGRWYVRDEHGNITSYSDEEFHERFQEVTESVEERVAEELAGIERMLMSIASGIEKLNVNICNLPFITEVSSAKGTYKITKEKVK